MHALGDGGAERLEPVTRGRGVRREGPEHVVRPVHEQFVEVNVQREVAPEPRHIGDASGAWVEDANLAAPVAIPGFDHASRHAVHREREVVVVRERHPAT